MSNYRLFIAYNTKVNVDLLPDVNDLTPPGQMKKADTIAAWREEQSLLLPSLCIDQPYVSSLNEVQIFDQEGQTIQTFKTVPDKASVSVRVNLWLRKRFPAAWREAFDRRCHAAAAKYFVDESQTRQVMDNMASPEAEDEADHVTFVGFGIRNFLKILGTDCSLPRNQPKDEKNNPDYKHSNLCSPSMWLVSGDYFDLESLIAKTAEYKQISWMTVLKAHDLQERYKGWRGPGQDVKTDLQVSIELATRLGILQLPK